MDNNATRSSYDHPCSANLDSPWDPSFTAQVSTADVHEYKSTTRAQLKRATADVEKDWGGATVGSEWLILYVRPFELEPSDKGAK